MTTAGIWHVEQEGASFVVYRGDEQLSVHTTRAAADEWMREHYWTQLSELKRGRHE